MERNFLGDRMKNYEAVSRHALMRRCPVIVRVDGRAFHAFTRGLGRPFDTRIVEAMACAAEAASATFQGCKLAYVQSDEASFLLTDYDSLETEPWFGYDLSKVVSLAAATMTACFNAAANSQGLGSAGKMPATFDARAFNVPPDEIANYFLWRAKDWRRNSIQMLAQANFSPKQLYGKKQADMLAMLMDKSVEWGALPNHLRCGRFYLPLTRSWREDVEPNYGAVAAVVDSSFSREAAEIEAREHAAIYAAAQRIRAKEWG